MYEAENKKILNEMTIYKQNKKIVSLNQNIKFYKSLVYETLKISKQELDKKDAKIAELEEKLKIHIDNENGGDHVPRID